MKVDGPRRMQLVMMRDITSDDFGNAFMTGLNNNVDKNDKSKIVTQISKFGEMFAQFDAPKKATCSTSTGFRASAPSAT
ncbi:chalcone isomerase family protein [Massilia sp. H-1]|nr:chalcone isomerase family protein [Massilia sp. H-1]